MTGTLGETRRAALGHERDLVLALGGFALDVPGATLVTHERVPSPRFNFVQGIQISAERQAAFFERVLDHYFQRALRPTFRLGSPVAGHITKALAHFGFRPRPFPRTLLFAARPAPTGPGPFEVRPAAPSELGTVVSFWAHERERGEIQRSIEVVLEHPNPGEEIAPMLAFRGDVPVAALLAYRYDGIAGLHGVSTQPDERGQGAASALVARSLELPLVRTARVTVISADHPRIVGRLESLGFEVAESLTEYELPADAELALAPPGPPGPPQWRPPRRTSAPSG
jgi:hypothetical protein